jgi:hypothetical protein
MPTLTKETLKELKLVPKASMKLLVTAILLSGF